MTGPVNPNHFDNTGGVLTPQPWMQWRHVAGTEVGTRTGRYPVTMGSSSADFNIVGTLASLFGSILGSISGIFGIHSPIALAAATVSAAGNKNELLHDVQVSWLNDSPINQWVYGKITRGGSRVTLQARSRGGLSLTSGFKLAVGDAGALTQSSMLGCGADMGNAGSLATGTGFAVIELRQNSVTIPLAPERAGWTLVPPGATYTARAQLRFVSEFWENTVINGGDSGTESSYETGATRLDLFAVPVI